MIGRVRSPVDNHKGGNRRLEAKLRGSVFLKECEGASI